MPISSPAVQHMLDREAKRVTPIKVFFWVLAAIVFYLSFQQSEVDFFKLVCNSGNMRQYIAGYFPPNWLDWKLYLQDTLVTVAMGVWGTLLAAIASAPLALLASNNVCPAWIVQPTRRVLDAMRAINEIVFALIFVVAVGHRRRLITAFRILVVIGFICREFEGVFQICR